MKSYANLQVKSIRIKRKMRPEPHFNNFCKKAALVCTVIARDPL